MLISDKNIPLIIQQINNNSNTHATHDSETGDDIRFIISIVDYYIAASLLVEGSQLGPSNIAGNTSSGVVTTTYIFL